MSYKKLQYPANKPTPGDTESIDGRLEQSHNHINKYILDVLDNKLLNDIYDIENKINIDMSNIDLSTLLQAIVNEGSTFIDTLIQNSTYGGDGGIWEEIINQLESGEITSTTLSITDGDTRNPIIELSPTTLLQLSSIASKANKLSGINLNNKVLTSDTGGDIKNSGIDINELLTLSHIVNDSESGGTSLVASAEEIKKLYELIQNTVLSVGQTRGSVYNAKTSSGSAWSIIDALIVNGGSGYSIGDIVGVSGGVIDGVFIVTDVQMGEVVSLDVVNVGAFEADLSGALSPYGGTGGGLVINVSFMLKPKTTLSSILNPITSDTCYVMEDETHGDMRSIWLYTTVGSSEGWMWLMSLSTEERDFSVEPITTSQLTDKAITNNKLDDMPSMTVKGNILGTAASPQDVPIESLLSSDNPIHVETSAVSAQRSVNNIMGVSSLSSLTGKIFFVQSTIDGTAVPTTFGMGSLSPADLLFFGKTGWVSLPEAGWVKAGQIYSVMFNGTNFLAIMGAPISVEGTTAQYWRGDKSWQNFEPAAIASKLTAPVLTNAAVATGDTIQAALGKLQAQVNDASGIIIQTTSPPGNAKKLWINSTSTMNTINYWNGSAWIPIRGVAG